MGIAADDWTAPQLFGLRYDGCMPATAATAVPGGRRREMGIVTANIEIANAYDEGRERHG